VRARKDLLVLWLLVLVMLPLGSVVEGAESFVPVHADPLTQPWRWSRIEELRNLRVRCMAEGENGVIWLATEETVGFYDGLAWRPVGAPGRRGVAFVNAMVVGRDGAVYTGTDWGIYRIRGEAVDRVFPKDPSLPWPVDDLVQDAEGNLWAGTVWGLLRLKDGEPGLYTSRQMAEALRTIAPEVPVSLVPDALVPTHPWDSRLVDVGAPTDGSGVGLRVAEGGWLGVLRGQAPGIVWAVAEGGPAQRAGLVVGDLVHGIAGHGQISQTELRGQNGTLVELEVSSGRDASVRRVVLEREETAGAIREFPVFDVCPAADGRIWVGLWDVNVLVLDPDPDPGAPQWQGLARPPGAGRGYGPKLAQGVHGRMWVVSNGGVGIWQLDGGRWRRPGAPGPASGGVRTAVVSDNGGNIWVGGVAISRFDGTRWSVHYPTRMGRDMPHHRLRLLSTTDGFLWMAGLDQGAVRLDLSPRRWQALENLSYETQTPDGTRWFLADGAVIAQRTTDRWIRYGPGDGLMDHVVALLLSTNGVVWAAGSHGGTAATARFDGARWEMERHPGLSNGIRRKAVAAGRDGSVWFGALGSYEPSKKQVGGVIRYADGNWVTYSATAITRSPYAIAQTPDGRTWVGGGALHVLESDTWRPVSEPEEVTSWIESLLAASDGSLWVGTRMRGVLRLKDGTWQRYDIADGLAGNYIRSITETKDGSIWCTSLAATSRFDGQSWTTVALPEGLQGSVLPDQEGFLWVNGRGMTVRYWPDAEPPETWITTELDQVSLPGNTAVAWNGQDRWQDTPAQRLEFSWRLDKGAWSPFRLATGQTLTGLASGNHRLQVRARDADHNVDPTPAAVTFTVAQPAWRQPWILGLAALLLGAIVVQTARVIRSSRSLKSQHQVISAQAAFLDNVLESFGYPFYVFDAQDRHIVKCNSAAREWGQGAAVNGSADAGRTTRREMAFVVGRVLASGKPEVVECTIGVGEAGRTAELHGFPVPDRDGKVLQVIVYVEDITERRLFDETQRDAERNRVLAETAGAAAHEINQPLSVILGLSQMFGTEDKIRDLSVEDLSQISEAGKMITGILSRMKATQVYSSRAYVGETRIVDFGDSADRERDG
jgi:ligand-binding sensor domain-containing protein/signal transduction histidine kinase